MALHMDSAQAREWEPIRGISVSSLNHSVRVGLVVR